MPKLITSKVTKRSQTTLPRAVKTVLQLPDEGRVGYVIEGTTVRLVNAEEHEDHEDPVIDSFLAFLSRDMQQHPERLSVFPPSLLERARAASAGVDIDHDAEIEGAITL